MKPNKGKRLIKIGGIGIGVSSIFAFIPLLFTIIAGLIATALGCQLDESGSHSCMVGSFDIGGELATVGLLGWLSFFTFPIAALAVLVFGIVVIVGVIRYFLSRQSTSNNPDVPAA